MKRFAYYGGGGIFVVAILAYVLFFWSRTEADQKGGAEVQKVVTVVRGNLNLTVSAHQSG